MVNRLKKFAGLIKNFNVLPKKSQKVLVKNMDNDLFCCVREISHNVLKGRVPLSSIQKSKLRRYKRLLRVLGIRSKSGVKKARKFINQNGAGLLPLLFSIVGPLISKIIS